LIFKGFFFFSTVELANSAGAGEFSGKLASCSAVGDPMFIKKQQRPWVEFSLEEGQQAPAVVHYFSDRCDPFKRVLPQLIEGAETGEERVFVVESPLSESSTRQSRCTGTRNSLTG
jgi:hypothetical protein